MLFAPQAGLGVEQTIRGSVHQITPRHKNSFRRTCLWFRLCHALRLPPPLGRLLLCTSKGSQTKRVDENRELVNLVQHVFMWRSLGQKLRWRLHACTTS